MLDGKRISTESLSRNLMLYLSHYSTRCCSDAMRIATTPRQNHLENPFFPLIFLPASSLPVERKRLGMC